MVQSEYTVIENNNGDLKMSKMTERARTYRLPNPSTPEDLECRWSKTLRYGDKVILAANVVFWAALIMTVYSGTEYVWKNRDVFSM